MSQSYLIGPNGQVGSRNGAGIYLPRRKHPVITIFNSGPVTLFLDSEDPLGQASPGQPLTPGSSVPWDADLPLYMTCPTPTGQAVITENSGVTFDVTALATAINDQGLAQDIADAIKITGAPPIDTNALITTVTAVNPNAQAISPVLDVSKYQSINISADALSSNTMNIRVQVEWYDSLTDMFPVTETFYIGTGGHAFQAMSVRAPIVAFRVIVTGTTGIPATINVYGSFKALASTYSTLSGWGGDGTLDGDYSRGVQTWSGTIPVSTAWVTQFDVIAGPAKLITRYISTNTAGITRLVRVPTFIFPLTTYLGETAQPTTAGQMVYDDILLPAIPFEIIMTNNSATQTLGFRATLVYARPFSA